jgi:hypothetical protein
VSFFVDYFLHLKCVQNSFRENGTYGPRCKNASSTVWDFINLKLGSTFCKRNEHIPGKIKSKRNSLTRIYQFNYVVTSM